MIQEENFTIGYNTAKTAKVFPLETFAVYSIAMYSTLLMATITTK